MQYPEYRPRRLRRDETLRPDGRETSSPWTTDLPLFAARGRGIRKGSLLDARVFQLSVENLAEEARNGRARHPGRLLFGLPAKKDPTEKTPIRPGIIQTAVRAIKDAIPDLMVVTDVCFCEYTDHATAGS